ncbi:MAG: glucoamylase family protein [Pseudomonadota bacterium]
MIIRALIGVLLAALCLGAQAAPPKTAAPAPAEPLPQRTLADFDQAQVARAQLRQQIKTWECPSPKKGKAAALRAEIVASKRGGQAESALRLSYHLKPATPASTDTPAIPRFAGVDIALPRLRIADYDHLRLWLRVDGKPAPKLRLRFNHPSSLDAPASARNDEGFNVIGLGSSWKQVLIPLNELSGVIDGIEPKSLSLVVFAPGKTALQGALEVDDIELVRIGQRVAAHEDRAVAAQKKLWEMAHGGEVAARKAIRARAIELPPGPLVRREPLPQDDQEFIQQVLRDTWRGLDGLRDRESGLPFDTVTFFPGGGAPMIGDYTNVTNIGLFMMSVIAARELGLVDAKGASQRLKQIVTTLEKLETYQGFFFNYYDTTSLERTSHFISFVDSAWLSAGLMTTRMAEPSLRPRIDRLLKKQNYAFFFDANIGQMAHGFHVQHDARSNNRYGLLYSEPRLGSLIAIGRGDVPESHWFSLSRTFPTDWTWQSMVPLERTLRVVDGHKLFGGYYLWQGMRYLPSWGGSMFEALMPALALDDQTYAPHSLGANAIAHVDIQRRYAQEVLNLPVWGMSPSANPLGGYGEYGISILGVKGYDESVVTPHASGLAAMLRPREAALNLREMAQLYPIYGAFGFFDAVEPKSGKVAYKYLALDQSMLFLGLANTVKPHLVQRYFAADPDIRRALPVVRSENFFK